MNIHTPTLHPSKADLIRNGITREEYRRRFGMDDAAFAYFSRMESDKALVEKMQKAVSTKHKASSAKGRILALLKPGVCIPARIVADMIGVAHSSAADDLRDLRAEGLVASHKADGQITLWRRVEK
jgi:hypothetical protein